MSNLKEEFWDRIADTRTGMLGAEGARHVPMSHYVHEDGADRSLWFITAKGTDLAKVAATGAAPANYIVSSDKEHLYANVVGSLAAVNDPQTLDDIWNAVASAWFDGGERDPDVQLLQLKLEEAEIWATGGSLKLLYEVAKAHATDEKPDMGNHALLRF